MPPRKQRRISDFFLSSPPPGMESLPKEVFECMAKSLQREGLVKETPKPPRLTKEQRSEFGKLAHDLNSPEKAIERFKAEKNVIVGRSNAFSMREQYRAALRVASGDREPPRTAAKMGRPPIMSSALCRAVFGSACCAEEHDMVKLAIESCRAAGQPVTARCVAAFAQGTVEATRLTGDSTEFSLQWAWKWIKRQGWTWRAATTGGRKKLTEEALKAGVDEFQAKLRRMRGSG
jgi:hypothetical protein